MVSPCCHGAKRCADVNAGRAKPLWIVTRGENLRRAAARLLPHRAVADARDAALDAEVEAQQVERHAGDSARSAVTEAMSLANSRNASCERRFTSSKPPAWAGHRNSQAPRVLFSLGVKLSGTGWRCMVFAGAHHLAGHLVADDGGHLHGHGQQFVSSTPVS